jgi:hypothetical protein
MIFIKVPACAIAFMADIGLVDDAGLRLVQ